MTRFRADFLLLLTALIWGTAFVAQKVGNGVIGPFIFIAGRFVLSALLVAPFAVKEAGSAAPMRRRDIALAVGIGVTLFAGAAGQQVGLVMTTVTNAGFITALYIAFVPFVGWAIMRTSVRPLVLVAVVVSLTGAWLLTDNGVTALSAGDFMVAGSALLFALHIVLVGLFQKSAHRPFFLSFTQYAVTALIAGAVGLAAEPVGWQSLRAALPTIAYAGILSGGVGYTLQIVAQRYTPATEAALIMSLESVFAAVAAAILLGERLTVLAALGCGLIMLGVVLVEIVPLLPRRAGERGDDLPPIGTVPLD
ncbi:MAG TPA: DMT family transporter [Alphaproteobacteria bacterium]|jgi:drug/metabolite transporter (DMT)-like permease|nr:DMT family transporter [Alphaproteobacteria bacterium]